MVKEGDDICASKCALAANLRCPLDHVDCQWWGLLSPGRKTPIASRNIKGKEAPSLGDRGHLWKAATGLQRPFFRSGRDFVVYLCLWGRLTLCPYIYSLLLLLLLLCVTSDVALPALLPPRVATVADSLLRPRGVADVVLGTKDYLRKWRRRGRERNLQREYSRRGRRCPCR